MQRLRLTSSLRLRPVPELEICLAYLRNPPRLLRLNLEAWALLEAVEASGAAESQAAAIRSVLEESGWQIGEGDLQRMLAGLEQQGLLQRPALAAE